MKSPQTGYQGSLKTIQLKKTKSHSLTLKGSEITPPGDSARITQGLGGYTRRVRSRAPSSELKYPPGDSARITRGLRGYTQWVRSRAPSSESKYPPGDSTRITRGLGGYTRRVRLRAPSGKSKHPRVILSESPGSSGATVGDLIPGYPMRWN